MPLRPNTLISASNWNVIAQSLLTNFCCLKWAVTNAPGDQFPIRKPEPVSTRWRTDKRWGRKTFPMRFPCGQIKLTLCQKTNCTEQLYTYLYTISAIELQFTLRSVGLIRMYCEAMISWVFCSPSYWNLLLWYCRRQAGGGRACQCWLNYFTWHLM